jgi:hypothetical protein
LTDKAVPSSAFNFPFFRNAFDFSKVIMFDSREWLAAIMAVDLREAGWAVA